MNAAEPVQPLSIVYIPDIVAGCDKLPLTEVVLVAVMFPAPPNESRPEVAAGRVVPEALFHPVMRKP